MEDKIMSILLSDNEDCFDVSSYSYNSLFEIEFDTKQNSLNIWCENDLIYEYIEEECMPSMKYPLGTQLIDFLELDFTHYNNTLNNFVTHSSHEYMRWDSFVDTILEHDIYAKHPYFNTIDGLRFKHSKMDFETIFNLLYIDIHKIQEMKSILYALDCTPYTPSFKMPIDNSTYRDNADYSIEKLFKTTQFLPQYPHYFFSINRNTHLFKSNSIGTRFLNISPLSFCFTEFFKSLEAQIKFKRCKNCGKLFIPTGNYNIEYCDRLYKDTNMTCKKIGASNQYKTKVKSNPILKEYNKAYKRNYARIGKNNYTNADFMSWVDTTKIERDKISQEYLSTKNEHLIIEFKQYLGNR